jgi:hypothetical protein
MSMPGVSFQNTLSYTGPKSNLVPIRAFPRIPLVTDTKYPVGQVVILSASPSTGTQGDQYYLSYFDATGQAIWAKYSNNEQVGSVITNIAGPVAPNADDELLMNASVSTFTDGTTANTLLVEVQATDHTIMIGAGAQVVPSELSPSIGSGIAVISQGVAADPVYGTVEVIGGGTGAVTLTGVLTGNGTGVVTAAAVTEHGVLVGGASNAVASTAVGTAGQVLTSSGAGVDPVWANNDGVLSSILVTTFAAGGTFTKDPNMVYCKIECLGGGGAGGGSNISTSSQCSCGGGGGAGEYSFGYFAYAAVGATETVTIGAAGAGISASTGGTGGTTSVGTLITSIGGSGGVAASAGYGPLANSGAGGSGGTGGDFRCRGMRGEFGFGFVEGNSPFQVNVKGGEGANSQYGSGGTPNGGAANLYGAGGGGSITTTSGADATGGSGSAGLVIVTEYIAT